jgi:hypothetical protein
LLSPYPLKENDEYSFEFVTNQGIRYVIYFLDYSSMFADYPEIAKQVFMFNIDVIEGNPDVGVSDERIGHTVLKVFNLFFQKSQNVAVYVAIPLMKGICRESENLISGSGNSMMVHY